MRIVGEMEKKVKKNWMNIVPQIINNLNHTNDIICPNCGKEKIDYMYVGDKNTRIGYLEIWCGNCLKGIHISRVIAPPNAKFLSLEDDIGNTIPDYEKI